MSLENCSSVAKRRAKRKYFGRICGIKKKKRGYFSYTKWTKALSSLFLSTESNWFCHALLCLCLMDTAQTWQKESNTNINWKIKKRPLLSQHTH